MKTLRLLSFLPVVFLLLGCQRIDQPQQTETALIGSVPSLRASLVDPEKVIETTGEAIIASERVLPDSRIRTAALLDALGKMALKSDTSAVITRGDTIIARVEWDGLKIEFITIRTNGFVLANQVKASLAATDTTPSEVWLTQRLELTSPKPNVNDNWELLLEAVKQRGISVGDARRTGMRIWSQTIAKKQVVQD